MVFPSNRRQRSLTLPYRRTMAHPSGWPLWISWWLSVYLLWGKKKITNIPRTQYCASNPVWWVLERCRKFKKWQLYLLFALSYASFRFEKYLLSSSSTARTGLEKAPSKYQLLYHVQWYPERIITSHWQVSRGCSVCVMSRLASHHHLRIISCERSNIDTIPVNKMPILRWFIHALYMHCLIFTSFQWTSILNCGLMYSPGIYIFSLQCDPPIILVVAFLHTATSFVKLLTKATPVNGHTVRE